MPTLTRPAHVIFVAAIVLFISLLLPVDIALYDGDHAGIVRESYDFKRRLFMIVLLSLPLGIHIYSINCLQVGKCVVWSWVSAIVVLLWIVCFLLLAFLPIP